MSYKRLFLRGELFGMDFLFNTLPNSLVPFDFKTFFEREMRFFLTVTDCETGEPVYYEKSEIREDFLTALQASCSLPFMSKPVKLKGRMVMDGGIADSIPIKKSIADGNTRHVIINTRPKGYRKSPFKLNGWMRRKYPQFKGLQQAMAKRHLHYNETMDLIDALEEKQQVFTVRPVENLDLSRLTRNKEKLYAAYDQGYFDASSCFSELELFLG